MLNDIQRLTAQAIVNIFETGTPVGDYGNVTLTRGDLGHLTYGRSQTTLSSGNLYLLVKGYCQLPDSQFGDRLSGFLERLAAIDLTLDNDMTFRNLLREAGRDPVMHMAQDQFFDRVYWTPAASDATAMNIISALGTGIVYDSHVQGSWRRIRDITTNAHGDPRVIGEMVWIGQYVAERRNWLATHPNPVLHATVYRMDAFSKLISDQKWDLPLPINVRGIRIDQDILEAGEPVRVSAHEETDRIIRLQRPLMVGADVEAVQRTLVSKGISVDVDGIYGELSEAAVRLFQQREGLTVDGIVGAATRSALGA
jgi:chitosanase